MDTQPQSPDIYTEKTDYYLFINDVYFAWYPHYGQPGTVREFKKLLFEIYKIKEDFEKTYLYTIIDGIIQEDELIEDYFKDLVFIGIEKENDKDKNKEKKSCCGI